MAQIVPHSEVQGYSIAHVEDQNTCFAVTPLTSDQGHEMVYSYYQTTAGQRWHVASFASNEQLPDAVVTVRVTIDGTETLARDTEARDGDFMLPFQSLPEITGHEDLVQTGDTMVIAVADQDALTIPLADYRAALGAITACLDAL